MHDDTDNRILETSTEHLSFKLADHYTLPRIKQFYKANGMRAQAPKGERIFIALSGKQIVAALRLQPIGDDYLLRSMCVSAALRQQGIGTALLKYIQPELQQIHCYCFPFSHLQDFYQQSGFIEIETGLAPEAIRDKFTRYINNGKNICLMKHQ